MTRIVELSPHNSDWAGQYAQEAARLTAVLHPILLAIHHVGSTAVPGILAKPIIDILVEVRDITAVDGYNRNMAALGCVAKGENGVPCRRYFRKGSDAHHTRHVHIFQTGHPEISRHLNFRDYLRAHPKTAVTYSDLKAGLAMQFRTDTEGYTNSKTAFIRDVDAKAARWRMRTAVFLRNS